MPDVQGDALVDGPLDAVPVGGRVADVDVDDQATGARHVAVVLGEEVDRRGGPGGLRVALLPAEGVGGGTRGVERGVQDVVARGGVLRDHLRLPVLIDRAVAVVVLAVDAEVGLVGVGVHVRVAVVAVVSVHVAVAVDVIEVAAIAVLVDAVVGDLDRAGVDARVRVVAVDVRGGSVGVGVGLAAVGVTATAIVVHAVATDLGGAGVHVRVAVVAVGDRGVAVAVGVLGRDLAVLVDLAVAVVVEAVLDLGRAGVDGRVAVVAVHVRVGAVGVGVDQVGLAGVATGVTVVGAGVGLTVVQAVVAVAVDAVAGGVLGPGVDVGVGVVAVAVLGGVALQAAGLHHVAGAVAVAVLVEVGLDDRQAVVDLATAVVVDAVADLGHAGVHTGVGVVAVEEGAVPVQVGVDRDVFAVAVVVRAVVGAVVAGAVVRAVVDREGLDHGLVGGAGDGQAEANEQTDQGEAGHGNSRGVVVSGHRTVVFIRRANSRRDLHTARLPDC